MDLVTTIAIEIGGFLVDGVLEFVAWLISSFRKSALRARLLCRSAVSGSTLAERSAGTQDAPSDTSPMTTAAPAKVAGSEGFTSNNRLLSSREPAVWFSVAAPRAAPPEWALLNTLDSTAGKSAPAVVASGSRRSVRCMLHERTGARTSLRILSRCQRIQHCLPVFGDNGEISACGRVGLSAPLLPLL